MVSPIAETTTTTSLPSRRVATMRSATRLIRSASATDEPPYFCTTSPTDCPFDCADENQNTSKDTGGRDLGSAAASSRADAGSGVSGERRLEDVQPLVQQVVADHQRRQEAQHVAERAGRQRDQPLAVAGRGDRPRSAPGPASWPPGSTSSTASIAPRPRTSPIDVVLRRPERRSRGIMIDSIRRAAPAQVLGAHRLDRAERGGAGDRVAAVGAAEAAGVHRVHDLGAAGDPGQRQAAGDALGGGDQVGHDALVLAGEPVAGAAEARSGSRRR